VTVATVHNRNNTVIVDGCAALRWPARPIPRNAECSGDRCGYCGFGCAYGTKRSTPLTYLRDALDAGAAVYANTRVLPRAHHAQCRRDGGGNGASMR